MCCLALADSLDRCLIDWLVCWLLWLALWLADWLAGWLVLGWVVGWGWSAGCTGLVVDWLAGLFGLFGLAEGLVAS